MARTVEVAMVSGERAGFSDDRQRVLDATDIVRLIGEQLSLKSKGREYVGLCPFHDDHAPSMNVVPHKQIYHCFSCGAGGNAIGFVMNYHKMSFREALQHLADRAGITLTPPPSRLSRRELFGTGAGSDEPHSPTDSLTDPPTDPHADLSAQRGELLGANATACTFFRAILSHPEHGDAARRVIERRLISPDMVERFQLGASPNKWDGLLLTIRSKGLDADPFRRAGLLKARENTPGLYDAMRNRLIFPIHDQIGRVVGFGGRRLDDQDEPKYLNSSESPIFDKSSTIYGIHQAAQEIRRSSVAIVTEGYMDTIACHQAGVANAVATLGTALTQGHARLLRRLCSTIVLLFDGDEAGQKAAERAVEVFFAEPVDVRIATLSSVTDAKDPDELLKREGGIDLLRRAIDRSTDPLDLLFSRVRASVAGLGVSARGRAIQDFATRLVEMGIERLDKVRYQLALKHLSTIAGVDWQTIAATLGERRARPRFRPSPTSSVSGDRGPGEGSAPSDWTTLGPREHLLGCVMCEPSLTLSLSEAQWEFIEPESFEDPVTRSVARTLMSVLLDEGQPSLSQVLGLCEDPEVQRRATRLASTVDRQTEGSGERLRMHWNDRLRDCERVLAASRTGAEPAAGAGALSRDARLTNLEALRARRAEIGEDRRAVPRPDS